MTASFVGNSIGGNLPTWIASQQGVLPTSSTAYAGALADRSDRRHCLD